MQHSDVEQTLVAQFDDVMNSAVDQGFNSVNHSHNNAENNSEPSTPAIQQDQDSSLRTKSTRQVDTHKVLPQTKYILISHHAMPGIQYA